MAIALAEADKYEILEKIGEYCLGWPISFYSTLDAHILVQVVALSVSFARSSGKRTDS